MDIKRLSRQTCRFLRPPGVVSWANVGGRLERQGPLGSYFDVTDDDSFFGKKTWEQGEAEMQAIALRRALQKGGLTPEDVDCVFAGDLLNQNIGATFSLRDFAIPFYGVYGACSTMGESLSLAAMAVAGGLARLAAAQTSSHFCTAERQYRAPVPYGSQRAPTAQWTVTGAGSAVLESKGEGVRIRAVHIGTITDYGITDAGNMGAAMAPAAARTIHDLLEDSATTPADYDRIVTGDLGAVGTKLLYQLMEQDWGIQLAGHHKDCGMMIYDLKSQDVNAGGSGCGCGGSVLCSHILKKMEQGALRKVLFVATGALMSPTSTKQGNSIPGVAHGVVLEV